MKNKKQLSLAVIVGLAAFSGAVTANDIPVVPLSVMKEGVPKPIVRNSTSPKSSINTSNSKMNNDSIVYMKPGVNQIVPIAVSHLNRIVTPFSTPRVTTSSDAVTEIRDNVIYIGTEVEYPVTLYITEEGMESQAMSLTLIPQKIPPREIFVKADEGLGTMGFGFSGNSFGNKKAEKWETSQPYVDTLKSIFANLALNNIPQGYTLGNVSRATRIPACAQSYIQYDFSQGQVVNGHHLNVIIGVAKNTASRPIELNEQMCGGWDIAGVAFWPHLVLEPGQSTEVYVAWKSESRIVNKKPSRPSLLGGSK